jgi:hypothetical protein
VAGMIELAALSAIAAHLPPRVRLLGLFAIAVGLAGGAALGGTARLSSASLAKGSLIVAALLLFASQVAVSLETWRIGRAPLLKQFQQDTELIEAIRQQREFLGQAADRFTPSENPLQQAIRDSDRRRQEESTKAVGFPRFLEARVSALGDWPPPWPLVYWLTEMSLSTLAGVWLASRVGRTTS